MLTDVWLFYTPTTKKTTGGPKKDKENKWKKQLR